jgi:hypothetical protein
MFHCAKIEEQKMEEDIMIDVDAPSSSDYPREAKKDDSKSTTYSSSHRNHGSNKHEPPKKRLRETPSEESKTTHGTLHASSSSSTRHPTPMPSPVASTKAPSTGPTGLGTAGSASLPKETKETKAWLALVHAAESAIEAEHSGHRADIRIGLILLLAGCMALYDSIERRMSDFHFKLP